MIIYYIGSFLKTIKLFFKSVSHKNRVVSGVRNFYSQTYCEIDCNIIFITFISDLYNEGLLINGYVFGKFEMRFHGNAF